MDITKILEKLEDGISVVPIEGKGKGVVTTRQFKKGELICEYRGECLPFKEAQQREVKHLRLLHVLLHI